MICTGSGGFGGGIQVSYMDSYMHYERPIPIVPPPPQMHSEDEVEPAYATGSRPITDSKKKSKLILLCCLNMISHLE